MRLPSLRRKLHVHRWRRSPAQRPHDFGMGQELASGTVLQCRKCFRVRWETFEIIGPAVRQGRKYPPSHGS